MKSEKNKAILDHLKALEVSLHQHTIRTDGEKLKALLHPSFVEIGYSGKTHNFESTLRSLLLESPSDVQVWSQDYEYHEYASTIIQVIYLSANMDASFNLTRHAKRSSIWVNDSGAWQMKFHQATPVAPFK